MADRPRVFAHIEFANAIFPRTTFSAGETSPPESVKRKGVQRVHLFDPGELQPRLILDVIPEQSYVESEIRSNGTGWLRLTALIRCLVAPRRASYAPLCLDVDFKRQGSTWLAPKRRLQFANFTIGDGFGRICTPAAAFALYDSARDGSLAAGLDRVASLENGIDLQLVMAPKPPVGDLGFLGINGYDERKRIVRVLRPIPKSAAEDGDRCPGDQLYRLRFESTGYSIGDGPVAVPAAVGDKQAGEQTLTLHKRRLGDNWNEHWKWDLFQEQVPQCTAPYLNLPEGAVEAKWLVGATVPAATAVDAWNSGLDAYLTALRTVQDGRPVTFLPRIETGLTPWPKPFAPFARWSTLSWVSDSASNWNATDDDPSIHLTPLSLFPREGAYHGAWFLGVRDHEGGPVTGSLTVPGTREVWSRTRAGKTEERDTWFSGAYLDTSPVWRRAQEFRGAVIEGLVARWGTARRHLVRMGSLDVGFSTTRFLDFGSLPPPDPSQPTSRFFLYLRPAPAELQENKRTTVEASAHAFLPLADVGPGGQDDLPGEEYVPEGASRLGWDDPCAIPLDAGDVPGAMDLANEREVERGFRTKAPVVVANPLGTDGQSDVRSSLLLEVAEDAQPNYDQRISLQILNPTAAGDPGQRAVQSVLVLDRNPFLVALVEFTNFMELASVAGAVVAHWTNAGLEGANWELRTPGRPFTMVLPPQAVGEDTEKHKPFETTEPKVADFRLSPTTRIELDPAYSASNFGEAPWNLRRLLGYAGQRSPGARIRKIESFELLYGLSCLSDYPFLRLAEIRALVGATPGRLHASMQWRGTASQEAVYKASRWRWANLHRLYLSRLGLLEPWDSHQPGTLTLDERLTCTLRLDQADACDPITGDGKECLKGGATWGFESANVYKAVKELPTSDSAVLAGPRFSALGAWGDLRTTFDQRRSTIAASATMGRTHRYVLERIGRIGVWWNRAKHVIVYERTVEPSKQFSADQRKLKGLPYLRKVEEYVEILQHTRQYPDDAGNETEEARQRRAGFVTSLSFPEGGRYRVKGAWGGDVDTVGWKVPLWNRAHQGDPLYPKPVVHVGVRAQLHGESVPASCAIDEPDNLVFYTDTRRDTGGDSDKWPPVKGIDYVDLPDPSPRARDAFDSGRKDLPVPADALVPPGFSPCTFRLVPDPAVAVDVVAGRAAKPLAAILSSVTLSRARAVGGQATAPLHRDLEKLSRSVASLLLPTGGTFADKKAEVTRVTEGLKAAAEKQSGALIEAVKEREGRLCIALESQIEELVTNRRSGLSAELENARKTLVQVAGNGQTALELAYKPVAEAFYRTIEDNLALLRMNTGPALRQARSYVLAAKEVVRVWNENVAKPREALKAALRAPFAAMQAAAAQRVEASFPLPHAGAAFGQILRIAEDLLEEAPLAHPLPLPQLPALPTDVDKILAAVYGTDWEKPATQWPLDRAHEELLRTYLPTLKKQVLDVIPGVANPAGPLDNFLSQMLAQVKSIVKASCDVVAAQTASFLSLCGSEVAAAAQEVLSALSQTAADDYVRVLDRRVNVLIDGAARQLVPVATDVFAVGEAAEAGMRLVRAFGEAPKVPGLVFPPGTQLGYFFSLAQNRVDLTPVLGHVDLPSAIGVGKHVLRPLDIELPTLGLEERLIPPTLANFKFSDILPNLAGMDLQHLFPALRVPDGNGINVRHGADPQKGRAWVETTVDMEAKEPSTLFSFGPLALTLTNARFQAEARVDAQLGESPRRVVRGRISGNWQLSMGGMVLVIFKSTELRFDDSGRIDFTLSPQNIEMPGALTMVADALKTFSDPRSGFSVGLLPTGIQAALDLPIPDVQGATTGFANLRLSALFALEARNEATQTFTLSIGFGLGRRDAPFTLTVFVLGGAGYLEARALYAPALSEPPRAQVDVSIMASASLAIALGPVSGGVYVYLGITARYVTGAAGLRIGIIVMVRGCVSVLGIASATICLQLQGTYDNGTVTGRGQLSISIRICWCFTLDINQSVEYVLAGDGQRSALNEEPLIRLASLGVPSWLPAAAALAPSLTRAAPNDRYYEAAKRYVDMLV